MFPCLLYSRDVSEEIEAGLVEGGIQFRLLVACGVSPFPWQRKGVSPSRVMQQIVQKRVSEVVEKLVGFRENVSV